MSRFTAADVRRIEQRRAGSSLGGRKRATRAAAQKSASPAIPALETPPSAFSLVLPWPPTGNTATRHTKTGRHYLTQGHLAFRRAVVGACLEKRVRQVVGPYAIELWCTPPDRRKRDFDNIYKTLADALQKAGAIEDDANMRQLTARMLPPVAPGSVSLWVWALGAG